MHSSHLSRVVGTAWINRTFDDIEAESVRALGLRDAADVEIFEEAK